MQLSTARVNKKVATGRKTGKLFFVSASYRKLFLRAPASSLLALSLPFSFFPRLINGDTQPWPLLAALLLLFSSKNAKRLNLTDVLVLFFAASAIILCFARAGFNDYTARFAYKIVSFAVIWLCTKSVSTELVALGMKMVIAIWFLVGLYQTVVIALGINVLFAGRIVVGRSGVSSLAPEPSLYGMLSVVAILYLLFYTQGTRPIYILMALANVFLSGSLLAVLASLFVVSSLSFRAKLAFFTILAPFIVYLVSTFDLQFLNRLMSFRELGSNWQILLADYSINLRVGHVVFTLATNLLPNLFLMAPVSFEHAYNLWASHTSVFLPTGSDFILTALGELIYNSGFFGLVLLIVFFVTTFRRNPKKPWIKVGIIFFLMLTQVGFSSIFLILFGLQGRKT